MNGQMYLPEGCLIDTAENRILTSSRQGLEKAMKEGKILEGYATSCRGDGLDLTVNLGCAVGIIPREEATHDRGGSPRDIAVITRVGRPVAFVITRIWEDGQRLMATLSRRKAQKMCYENYISKLCPGDIIKCSVTHLDTFGAFVDIGCGIVSLLSVDCISVSRIAHPSDRLKKGQILYCVVKSVDRESGRIYMTLRELLGTWEENAAAFEVGSTVVGIVRSIESYGVFVELSPNLAGLAERREGVQVGDGCSVYIKSIIKDRMKVKLSLVDTFTNPVPKSPVYFTDPEKTKHISYWKYSPEGAQKHIETVFE